MGLKVEGLETEREERRFVVDESLGIGVVEARELDEDGFDVG